MDICLRFSFVLKSSLLLERSAKNFRKLWISASPDLSTFLLFRERSFTILLRIPSGQCSLHSVRISLKVHVDNSSFYCALLVIGSRGAYGTSLTFEACFLKMEGNVSKPLKYVFCYDIITY